MLPGTPGCRQRFAAAAVLAPCSHPPARSRDTTPSHRSCPSATSPTGQTWHCTDGRDRRVGRHQPTSPDCRGPEPRAPEIQEGDGGELDRNAYTGPTKQQKPEDGFEITT